MTMKGILESVINGAADCQQPAANGELACLLRAIRRIAEHSTDRSGEMADIRFFVQAAILAIETVPGIVARQVFSDGNADLVTRLCQNSLEPRSRI